MVAQIFEKNYQHYCDQIEKIDFMGVKDRLGIEADSDLMRIPFLGREYRVSRKGFFDAAGDRPNYGICVILAKYVLLVPDKVYTDPGWVSFRDFKRASHFTNVNFFTSDTEQAIVKQFSGKLDALAHAGQVLGGLHHELGTSYDLAMEFAALPRISLLMLFNDKEDSFPAHCSVLFQKHAEFYLDPESLAMTSAGLAKRLKETTAQVDIN